MRKASRAQNTRSRTTRPRSDDKSVLPFQLIVFSTWLPITSSQSANEIRHRLPVLVEQLNLADARGAGVDIQRQSRARENQRPRGELTAVEASIGRNEPVSRCSSRQCAGRHRLHIPRSVTERETGVILEQFAAATKHSNPHDS